MKYIPVALIEDRLSEPFAYSRFDAGRYAELQAILKEAKELPDACKGTFYSGVLCGLAIALVLFLIFIAV